MNKYILLLDILGYSGLCKKFPPRELINHIASLFTGSAHVSEMAGTSFYVYADSILIVSEQQGPKELERLVRAAQMIQYGEFYKARSPARQFIGLRGAIGYGTIEIVRNISTQATGRPAISANNILAIAGDGLVDAAETEKKLDLMAVAVSQRAIEATSKEVLDGLSGNGKYMLEYSTPIKGGTSKFMWLVNPLEGAHLSKITAKVEELATIDENQHFAVKWQNTTNFIKHCGELLKAYYRQYGAECT